jgi:membrane protease YdiL (CAAX protease family)
MTARSLEQWPWYFLAPVILYAVLVLAIPPLRRSVHWLRVGRLHGPILATTVVIVLLSSTALVLYQFLFHPDLSGLAALLPIYAGIPLLLTGAVFAVGNAALEEVIFRGVLQDALASQVGQTAGVAVQAIVFGLGHARGYPPGEMGVVLAGLYGLMLGVLREWSGGLAVAFVAHVFADATIYAIVVFVT